MTGHIQKIRLPKHYVTTNAARKQCALAITAIRSIKRERKANWNRLGQMTRSADLLPRHSDEAAQAGFDFDSRVLRMASRAVLEATI